MESSADNNISLLLLVTRRWRLVLCTLFACIGFAGLATLIIPKRYESEMKFLVNNERADLVITPNKDNSTTSGTEVSEAQVNSEMELLKSRDILQEVAKDERLYQTFQRVPKAAADPLSLERAIIGLQKRLSVSALRKSNIIEVRYGASDPSLAAAVLRDIGSRYLSAHLAVHSPPGTLEFFTDQAAKNRERLRSAEAALSEFHRQYRLFALPQQQAGLVNRLQAVESQIQDLDAEQKDLESRLQADRRQLGAIPERVTTQIKTVPSQLSTEQLRTMLTNLRNRRLSLAMKFKPGDRLITELDQEIQNTSNSLAQAEADRPAEQTTDLDPLHQSLNADAVRAQVSLQGVEARRLDLSRARAVYLQQLDSMDEQSLELRSLERNVKEAEDNYNLYSRRVEEAKLAASLDREKFANVALIEKPEPSPVPVFPKLRMNLACGAAMGIFLAIGLAFLLETRQTKPPEPGNPLSETVFGTRAAHARASGD